MGGIVAAVSLEQCLEKIRSGPVPKNEESAKFQLIAPVLRSLDWNPEDASEFLLEHPVGGKAGGRVDIALRSGDHLMALIEAKAPGADLRSHVTQVLGYAFHDGVDICVLTTGLEWWLYLPLRPGKPSERRFAVLDLLNDSVERLVDDLTAFLHKERLVGGEAKKKAELVLQANLVAAQLESEIPRIWDAMVEDSDPELVELIGSRVYEKLNLRPHKEQIVAVLRGKPVPMALDSAPVDQTKKPKAPPIRDEPAERSKRSPRPSVKPVAIMLWGERYPVGSHKEILKKVMHLLYENHVHEFDKALQLKGRKHSYMSPDPAELGAEGPSKSFFQVESSKYYVYSHGSAETMRKRSEQFLECFGYDKSDLEILFD